jgi:FkbM family methyltransferase
MKSLLKRLLEQIGLRVSRTGAYNRFDALEDVLGRLQRMGFRPKMVVDGGANVGAWTRKAKKYFPEAEFHLVEMQADCVESLRLFAAGDPKIVIHHAALVEPGVERVSVEGSGTGASVAAVNESDGPSVVGKTLDELFADRAKKGGPTFLKLDLEGHELNALKGATELLPLCDFLLLETSFYDPLNSGTPTFEILHRWLGDRGFILNDVASMSQRNRDGRLRMADLLYHRRGQPFEDDVAWE